MPTKEIAPGVLAVTELPDDAKNPTVIESHGYFPSPRIEHSIGGVDLPSGEWSIVGWSDELTEDQCADFVDSWESVSGDGTIIYQRYPDEIPKCRTAIKSFQSLLRSHGITDRALIIKKEK